MNKLKADLRKEIKEKTHVSTQGKLYKELQDIASQNIIPELNKVNDIEPGWVGKARGMQQILLE